MGFYDTLWVPRIFATFSRLAGDLHTKSHREDGEKGSKPPEDEKYRWWNFILLREWKLNTNIFSQTFRAPPGYPGKIPGYPAKKFGFPGFEGTYRTLRAPTPSRGKPPTPPKDIRTQKFGFGFLFLPWLLLLVVVECGLAKKNAIVNHRHSLFRTSPFPCQTTMGMSFFLERIAIVCILPSRATIVRLLGLGGGDKELLGAKTKSLNSFPCVSKVQSQSQRKPVTWCI